MVKNTNGQYVISESYYKSFESSSNYTIDKELYDFAYHQTRNSIYHVSYLSFMIDESCYKMF